MAMVSSARSERGRRARRVRRRVFMERKGPPLIDFVEVKQGRAFVDCV